MGMVILTLILHVVLIKSTNTCTMTLFLHPTKALASLPIGAHCWCPPGPSQRHPGTGGRGLTAAGRGREGERASGCVWLLSEVTRTVSPKFKLGHSLVNSLILT